LTEALKRIGFCATGSPCIYLRGDVLCFFYVDDICLAGPDKLALERLAAELGSCFKLNVLGELQWFLKTGISRDRAGRRIWMNQRTYIERIARALLPKITSGSKGSLATPLPGKTVLMENLGHATKSEIKDYQRRIGSVLYATVVSRPDCAKAVNALAQFLVNPSAVHFQYVNNLIQHLLDTSDRSICYGDTQGESSRLVTYGDASLGGADGAKAGIGIVVMLQGGPIAWKATKLHAVALSTAVAELHATEQAARAAMYWTRLLVSLGDYNLSGSVANPSQSASTLVVPPLNYRPFLPAPVVCTDNRATQCILEGDDVQYRGKLSQYIDFKRLWIKQEVDCGRLTIRLVRSGEMIADGTTKLLDPQPHRRFVGQLGLQENGQHAVLKNQ
jgi:hypothetical protein